MVSSTCSHATWRKARKTCAYVGEETCFASCACDTPPPWNYLQAGVDRAVIALWLGHESVETTQIYLDADLALKEQALAKTKPVKGQGWALPAG